MESKNKELTDNITKTLSNLAQTNNIIGKPIKLENNITIIPLTSISYGMLTGGGEYGKVKEIKKDKSFPQTVGSGSIVSIKPVGFLIVNDDKIELIKTDTDIYAKLIDKVSDFINEKD